MIIILIEKTIFIEIEKLINHFFLINHLINGVHNIKRLKLKWKTKFLEDKLYEIF